MLGNCKICGDRFYFNFYPVKTMQVPIECPKCHGHYKLVVPGSIENFVRSWWENDPELIDRLADYYYHEPLPEDPHEGERWPDLEEEYTSDTTSTNDNIRVDMHTNGYPYSSNYPNDALRIGHWDRYLDNSFKMASFNPSHLKHKKRDQISNFIFL